MKTVSIYQQSIFGVITDFKLENEVKGDIMTTTLSCVMPRIQWDIKGKFLVVMPPTEEDLKAHGFR